MKKFDIGLTPKKTQVACRGALDKKEARVLN
jgi:hypothetical protein